MAALYGHRDRTNQISGPKMMRLSPFGGGATNERPAVVKASSSDDDTTKCRHKLNTSTKQRCMEDVYKARCSDLERQIVQLKLELAEAKTANAYIVKENRTLNEELREQEKKVGQLLVENSKLGMESMTVRRDLHLSVKREGSWKERVDELHEENVQLRHIAVKRTNSALQLSNLLTPAKSSAGSLVSSLSGLFGGADGDSPQRHEPSTSTRLSRSNSYGLKRAVSTPSGRTCTSRGGSVHPLSASSCAARSTGGGWDNHSMSANESRGNSTWDPSPLSAASTVRSVRGAYGGRPGAGANMFLSILEGQPNP